MSRSARNVVVAGVLLGALLVTGCAPVAAGTVAGSSHAAVVPPDRSGAFSVAATCAPCHGFSPSATALRGPDGTDASPHGLWRGTVMAAAFVDPVWRAAVAAEQAAHPDQAEAIGALCARCHAPLAHHDARLLGAPEPGPVALTDDPLAGDGVSCTLCHQVQDVGLGTPETWDGHPVLTNERRIFGPYAAPFAHPMRRHTGYTPEHGPQVECAALCATCHTLRTAHAPGAPLFLEQSPYLEWRNSRFSDEPQASPESRTCQSCHMVDMGSMRIAHNPMGGDFPPLGERPGVRGHGMLGGNALLLDLLATDGAALGSGAPAAHHAQLAAMTRSQLARASAGLVLEDPRREADRLLVDMVITNLTGHKLPTGHPARRAWLELVVRVGSRELFRSGTPDGDGRLFPAGTALGRPHVDRLERPEQVVLYELVAADGTGAPTTSLIAMETVFKDSRLLPAGWRPDGPDGEDTAPVGTAQDGDFTGGGDRVHVAVPLPPDARGPLIVEARLLYQALPPAWRDALLAPDGDEARRLAPRLAAAGPATEVLAEARGTLPE